MRGPALLAFVLVSFAVLASEGCTRRHYRVTLTETVPSAVHRPGDTRSAPPPARRGAASAAPRPSNSNKPSPVPVPRPAGAVATSGDELPSPEAMQGTSDVPAEPDASVGTADRRSEAGGTIALTKQGRPPYNGGSGMRWFRPVLFMSLAAAVLLIAIVALRSRRRVSG